MKRSSNALNWSPLRPRPWTSIATMLAATLFSTLTLRASQVETEVTTPSVVAPDTYPAALIELSSRPEFSKNFFVVDKARRFLRVYKNDNGVPKLVMEVPSDLGKSSGPKLRENDHKTPVGIYFLQERKSQPEIPFETYGQLAFTTDYPNIFDKRESRTGHGIWLHAVPDNVPLTRGSRGCVVVRNDMIKTLQPYIALNQTPILIFEQLKEIGKDDYLKQREEFKNFVETWRKSWQEEDIETYIKFYDPTFYNADMNFRQWYRHKKRLKGRYSFMKVKLSDPVILRNEDQVVIRVLQEYQSDKHIDFGEKTIHANYSPETGFKIVREDWKAVQRPDDWPAPQIPETIAPPPQNLTSAAAQEPTRSPASTNNSN